jgi:predicted TIM-barrel fold metal-dependent hydrolase
MAFNQLHAGRDEPILDPDLPIVDSHFHLWDRPALRYMFGDYLADIQSGHRIVASVFVETQAFNRKDGPEMFRPLGEIEFANGVGAMADSGVYGDCRVCAGIVGHADLRHGAAIGEYLDAAMAIAPRRFRGVRQITIDDPTEPPYRYLTMRPARGLTRHPEFRNAFAEIGKRGLSFDAAMFHHQLGDVADLADAFPDTTIVLGHAGHMQAMGLGARERDDLFKSVRKTLFDLAMRPNIVVKIGGLGLPFWGFGFEERTDAIGYLELAQTWRPYVEASIEAFGVERSMMESNYPPDGRSAGYVPTWNALKHIVRAASHDEKTALFSATAARVYRLDLGDVTRVKHP